MIPRQMITSLETLVPLARLRALRGIYDGRMSPRTQTLLALCSHYLRIDGGRYATVIYTRDAGHHTSGWWKNPDYERCLHISVAYRSFLIEQPLPQDLKETRRIAEAFFGEHTRLAWIEPPYSPEGKTYDVWHYRLFCDPSWAPTLPKGEVYSREDTPAGWKSFSDIHGAIDVDAPFLRAASE